MCVELGFQNVRTYIASGNVVFTSTFDEGLIKSRLEARLQAYAGRDVTVVVRTASELSAVLNSNPFSDKEPRFTVAIFLDKQAGADILQGISGQVDEKYAIGKREIFVHYGNGMGRSKLKIPGAKSGTARNMNTIAKLVEMVSHSSVNPKGN